MMLKFKFIQLLVLIITALIGCNSGSSLMRAWGEISYDGKAIEEGEIIFFPIEGTLGPSTGAPIKNGSYDIPAKTGLVSNGTYRIEITGLRKVKYIPGGSGGGPLTEVMQNFLPDSYNKKSNLILKVSNVTSENNRIFNLEKLENMKSRFPKITK